MPAPAHLEQIFGHAMSALQQGALDVAERQFKSLLVAQPNHLGALNLLGVVQLRLGKAEDAERSLRKAIRSGSNSDPATLCNYAMALRQLGRSSDALVRLDQALAIQPDNFENLNSRGMVLNDLGRYAEAVGSFEKAVAVKPDAVSVHYNLGNSFALLKRYDEALAACDRAIALAHDFALAWYGRSQSLKVLGRGGEALDAFEKYLLLATPRTLPGWRDVVDLAKDLFAFDLVPAIYPDEAAIAAARARLDALIGGIERRLGILANLPGPPGVVLNAIFCVAGFNIAYQQRNDIDLNRRYSLVLQKILGIHKAPEPRPASRSPKIRLGIASGNLRDHNGTRWALDWLAQLPRKDYSFFVYAFNPDLDDISKQFAALGQFQRLAFNEGTVLQTIASMRNDSLDILLMPDVGMSPGSRVLSQFRIAPIQLSAWGHPVTTGSPNIDYYLSSELMEPADAQDHYSEKLVRLPNLALYIKPSRYPVDDKLSFPLPENCILYGCLQSLFKYLPQFDFVFTRIAARVPEACFLFIEGNPSSMTSIFRDRLRALFSGAGLDFERSVRFLPRMTASQFGGLLRKIDVNIDSIGWSGGNSTIASLEADCPLVALPTQFMRGRHSFAMLRMIGLDELIANSTDDLVDKLVRLGTDRDFRAAIVQKIARSKHRLYEDKSFIDGLDRFLKEVSKNLARP